MKLILFKNGDTDPQKVKAMALAKVEDAEGRALILYLASGDMAVLKCEDAGELAQLISALQG